MLLVRGLKNYPANTEGCIATIGNFDGVHRGHCSIFARVAELGRQHKLPCCAVSFEPLPHEFFRTQSADTRLSTLRDKYDAIAGCNIDRLLILAFNRQLSEQQADAFIQQTLLARLGVRHLVVGDDFRFGHKREGDYGMLEQAGQQHGFSVESFHTVVSQASQAGNTAEDTDKERISSSAIRQALADFDFKTAGKLIGRPYQISGRVVKGQQLARQLGYATANVCLKDFRPSIRGVFAVTAEVAGGHGQQFNGVANLGERPTVDGKRLLLEAHVFDAEPDLYGQVLRVSFHHFLRGEKKFDSLDELKAAIAHDATAARDYFSSTT